MCSRIPWSWNPIAVSIPWQLDSRKLKRTTFAYRTHVVDDIRAHMTNMKPSSCSLTAHLVVAMSAAAFVMPYAAASAMAAARINPRSAPAVLTTTIFFVGAARRRGRNTATLWTTPDSSTVPGALRASTSLHYNHRCFSWPRGYSELRR
ncbi:hypothetical protein K466DRAFT_374867 [Polyporus arcularius HHB13444]|uniref:Uncharacterized protein n=1 Tax=Polyporus arcularius HHB13444 TaxID=1314778 RepID=A0A5C3NWZ5_9APHY|nr:hypothetical protein K466DRAFT_374867 [Polyporus arcularius HHB13444]